MPAEKLEELVKERLRNFGLKLEDIVIVTTDGTTVMKRFEIFICCIHQPISGKMEKVRTVVSMFHIQRDFKSQLNLILFSKMDQTDQIYTCGEIYQNVYHLSGYNPSTSQTCR